MMDASDPTRLSASCAHLLGLLSADLLAEASVLILFNKMYGGRARREPRGELPQSVAMRVASGRAAAGLGRLGAAPFDKALLWLQ